MACGLKHSRKQTQAEAKRSCNFYKSKWSEPRGHTCLKMTLSGDNGHDCGITTVNANQKLKDKGDLNGILVCCVKEHKGLNSEGDPDRQKHARINEHTRWKWTTPWRDTAWLCSPFLSRGGFSRVSMSISSILQLPYPPPPNISHQCCPHTSPSMRKMMITWQPCFVCCETFFCRFPVSSS